ncbi:MAG: flagellin [Candidatus Gastranaerophilales bacterium]|nr:flagellin [Candidatus Gastranaerophilales bacterium]
MAITVNTNLQALRIQTNLSNATDRMNTAMERMSSGSKINSAKDDAAGLAVATGLTTTISSSKVATSNVKIGSNLLDTAEGTLNVITDNLQRINDLITEAANGTYSDADLQAISEEVAARVAEIKSLAANATFNDVKLFGDTASTGAASTGITLQVGTTASDTINLDSTIFGAIDSTTLTGLDTLSTTIYTSASGGGATSAISGLLSSVDSMISTVTTRETKIGAAQNKLEAVSDGLDVQQTNLKAARSTILDADVAEESAQYVAAQILQSASATLLVQANSAPQIALTLIQG